jgi:hypothetical protein
LPVSPARLSQPLKSPVSASAVISSLVFQLIFLLYYESILAAYDFGASAELLQSIFDEEKSILDPIDSYGREKHDIGSEEVLIDSNNWKEYLHQEG